MKRFAKRLLNILFYVFVTWAGTSLLYTLLQLVFLRQFFITNEELITDEKVFCIYLILLVIGGIIGGLKKIKA